MLPWEAPRWQRIQHTSAWRRARRAAAPGWPVACLVCCSSRAPVRPSSTPVALQRVWCSRKCALAVDVEVLDDNACRFALCPDRKRDGAQAVRILPDRLVGEHVARKMRQREAGFVRSLDEHQPPTLCNDPNLTKEIVVIGADIGGG